MDLAGHARAFLGDGASVLGEADRAPRAGEQKAVREQPEEVAARDGSRREDRCEHVVQRREEHERRRERKPAVEVFAPLVEALAEPDDGEQVEQRLRREDADVERRGLPVGRDRREVGRGRSQRQPDDDHRDARRDDGVRECARPRAAGNERRRSDEHPTEEAADDAGPRLSAVDGPAGHERRDREQRDREREHDEARAEEEVEAPALHCEADAGEEGDDGAGERDDRLEDEPELREGDLRLEVAVRDEEGEGRSEQAEEEDLSPEPGLEVVSAVLSHVHSCRQIPSRR